MKKELEKKLKEIRESVEQSLPVDRYKATFEQIVHAQLAVEFLGTQAGKDLQGEEIAKKESLMNEQVLRVKRAELQFLSDKITKNG